MEPNFSTSNIQIFHADACVRLSRGVGVPAAHMRQHGKFEYLKLKNWCQTPFPNDFLENLIPSFLDGFGDVLRFSDMLSCPGTVPDHSGMDLKSKTKKLIFHPREWYHTRLLVRLELSAQEELGSKNKMAYS